VVLVDTNVIIEAVRTRCWTVTRYETACHAAVRVRGSGLQGAGACRERVPRTELVWANPRAVAACQDGPSLFRGGKTEC
jgi:hypothetical protein